MKYLIELVADTKGLEPAIDGIQELNQKERELKKTTTEVSAEQKKLMDNYATQAKIGKENLGKLTQGYKEVSKAATGDFGGKAMKDTSQKAITLTKYLRLSTAQLKDMAASGKLTSDQLFKAASAIAELKQESKDVDQTINTLASSTFKFDAALQALQFGAAGFQAITAGAALFGEESEDVQKTLVKLNGVMALTQAGQQLVNLAQKQSALSLGIYSAVVGKSTGVLRTFRIVLASVLSAMGVGVIIAVIANWEKLKGAISDVNSQLAKNLDLAQKNLEIQEELSIQYDLQEAQAKLRGETEEQILRRKIDNARIELELIEDVKIATAEQTEAFIKSNEKRTANLKTLNPFLMLAALFKKSTKEVEEQTKKQTDINNKYTSKQKDIVDIQIRLKEIADERSKKLAEEEAKRLEKANEEYRQSLIRRREIAALSERLETENLKKMQKERIRLRKEQMEKEEDIYRQSLKNRRDLEAQQQRNIEDLYLEKSKKRFEKRRGEIKLEIDLELEKQQAISDAAIQIAQQTSDAIFQIVNSSRNAEFNAEIQRLNELKDREIKDKDLTDAQKARIEERYQRKIAEIKTKQARADKAAAIAQAIINGALAITKIFTSVTALNPAAYAAIAVTAASTAAQIAVISAQKIPKFAKGTEYVKGGGTETSDSIPAMLSKGERVIDAKTNKLLKGIPNKMIPELLMPSSTVIKDGMDYDRLAKSFSKELANNPQLLVNFDRKGFETFIKSGNTTTQIKNNRNAV